MSTPIDRPASAATRRLNMVIGGVLIVVGLVGHVFAARAIGGTHLAYRDHIGGFVLIALVSGLLIAAIGWRFWRRRFDITFVIFGAVQAIMGVFVYIERFSVHT